MRCLYCGNELALLKKLTGGGEFCSEAHRQKYQEEYNRLALSRLLQAQPAAAERPPLESGTAKANVSAAANSAGTRTRTRQSTATLDPPSSPPPQAAAAAGQPDPPQCGFLPERFEPVLSPRELFSNAPFLAPIAAYFPGGASLPAPKTDLNGAGMLPLAAQTGWKSAEKPGELRLETREFSRPAPSMEFRSDTRGPHMPERAEGFRALTWNTASSAVADAGWQAEIPDFAFETAFAENLNRPHELRSEEEGEIPVELTYLRLLSCPEPAAETEPLSDFQETFLEEPSTPVEEVPVAAVSAPEELAVPEEPLEKAAAPALPVEPPPAVESAPDAPAVPTVVIDLSIFESMEDSTEKKNPDATAPSLRYSTGELVEDSPVATASGEPIEHTPPAEPAPEPLPEPLMEQAATAGHEEQVAGEVAAAPEPEPPPAEPPPPPAEPLPRAAVSALPLDFNPADAPSCAGEPVIPPGLPRLKVSAPGLDGVPMRPKMFFGRPPVPAEPPVPPEPVEEAAPVERRVPADEKPVFMAASDKSAPAAAQPEKPADKSQPEKRGGNSARRESKRKLERNARSMAAPEPSVSTALAPEPEPAAQPEPAPVKAPAAEPRRPVLKKAQPEPAPVPEPSRDAELDELRLHLETAPSSAGMGVPAKLGIGVGLALALVLAGFLMKSVFASKPAGGAGRPLKVEPVGQSLVSSAGSWTADWAGSGTLGPQISLLRSTTSLSDYRIEFQGQIENKAIGWIFRAENPKNYYANRIEMHKAGLDPEVVLVHYAVINGEQTARSESKMPFKVHLDTVYKVRTDVFASEFKTYIQEQLVDSWSDDRLKTGAVGVMGDRGERNPIRLLQLYELRASQ